ncbi:MAG: PHP domain protein [Firmicutes bacterium ADurb.Bin300]|nr:MAG: PHP domain protein [Firmicutes bacterium ADurb.Bin300]
MGRKWLAGVTHAHTVASDGGLTLEELIEKAKKNKLDFLIITDHNVNCKEDLPESAGITLIYGTEMTYKGGHANVWGVKEAVDDFTCDTYEQWLEKKNEAKKRGAVICMNHPLCTLCPWRWEKDISQFDVLEVWNAPMHYDNLVCTDWWDKQLREGHKTPVVGGSDYHRDYRITNLLANPVTYVLSEGNTPEDILGSIMAGHTTISSGVGKTMIELRSGEYVMGDTVKLSENSEIEVIVKKLKKGHSLVVYNQTGEIYRHTAKKTGNFSVKLPVKSPGFFRAEVRHTLSPIFKFGYNIYIGKRIPEQRNIDLPAFISAMTGAIFFE